MMQHTKKASLSRQIIVLTLLLATGYSSQLLAHAEHDRGRFVATSGVDQGRCDSPLRPCRTISYAIAQANKGDKVLVADGSYALGEVNELFMLTGDIVPVLGGFNKFDHFQSQAPQLNRTVLTGVPVEYAKKLSERGFVVLSDGKAVNQVAFKQLQQVQAELQQSQTETPCVNGKAGAFPCKNIDLVSHVALGDFSLKPGAANDIWGHVDLNTGTEYAIIGLENGTAVMSLADPAKPVEVGAIAGKTTVWRDIKVLQFFDTTQQRWRAYAYVSSEATDKIQIIDLSQLPHSIRLVAADPATDTAHNVYISHVDYTTNTTLDGLQPLLHIVGQRAVGGAFTSYSLKNPEKLQSLFAHSSATRDEYTHDAASMVVNDSRAQQSCNNSRCTVLMDFNEKSVKLWNISELNTAKALADLTYSNAEYVHSGWWSEDKRFVFVHDELDESRRGLNTTVRVLNVDSLNNPVLVKEWSGPSRAIDHNGYTRGNRYYISNYQRGTTILDISNPAEPVEVGYFDSYPASDGAAFNGVWGTYPYLPSGLIISSDINSGLYVLRDQTKNSAAGQVFFAQAKTQVTAGAPVEVVVRRPQGSGAVSVAYETQTGQSQAETLASGRLSWAADDHQDKTIRFTLPEAAALPQNLLYIRLFDPQQGLSLGSPSYQWLSLKSSEPAYGAAGFVVSTASVDENSAMLTLKLNRFGGDAGPIQLRYQLQDGTALAGRDMAAVSGEVSWTDGDNSEKTIQVPVLDNQKLDGDRQFKVVLSAISGALLADGAQVLVTIVDNERNSVPVLTGETRLQANPGQTVLMRVNATDVDGDVLSYNWQQSSGPAVVLTGSQSVEAGFVAPAQAAELAFKLVVNDSRGGSAELVVNVSVRAVSPPPIVGGGGGGSSGGAAYWWLCLAPLCGWRLRQSLRLSS